MIGRPRSPWPDRSVRCGAARTVGTRLRCGCMHLALRCRPRRRRATGSGAPGVGGTGTSRCMTAQRAARRVATVRVSDHAARSSPVDMPGNRNRDHDRADRPERREQRETGEHAESRQDRVTAHEGRWCRRWRRGHGAVVGNRHVTKLCDTAGHAHGPTPNSGLMVPFRPRYHACDLPVDSRCPLSRHNREPLSGGLNVDRQEVDIDQGNAAT